jgi:hypothetical protein
MKVSARFGPIPLSVVLDGTGMGTVSFQATGDNIRISNLFVKVSTQAAQAVCTFYKGQIGDGFTIGNTNSGSTGQIIGGNIDLLDGEFLYIVWRGGDPGATATATVTGTTIPFADVGNSSLQYSEPIAAGDGSLIYPSLQSPNYEPGVSGWYLGKDGMAEFGEATIRGEFVADNGNFTINQFGLAIVGTDQVIALNKSAGLYIESAAHGILEVDTSNGTDPYIYMKPADAAGHTIVGAQLNTNNNVTGADVRPYVQLGSPTIDGKAIAAISISGESSTSATTNRVYIYATQTHIENRLEVEDRILVGPDLNDIGRGIVSLVMDTSNSATVGNTETSILNIGSTTYRANRCYKIEILGRVNAPASFPAMPIFRTRKTNAAGQVIAQNGRIAVESNQEYACPPVSYFTVGNTAVTATITLTIQGSATFNAIHIGSATGPRGLVISDVGPDSIMPLAPVLV